MIVNGFLDNNYSKFIVDTSKVDISNVLKRNDIIYIKGIEEGRSLNMFLNVETPDLVIKRLNKDDFMRDNILNMNIFKTCLEKDMVDKVIAITKSITNYKKYGDLWWILSELGLDWKGKYFNILLYNDKDLFDNILNYFKSKTDNFNNIMISILITEHTDDNKLKLLKKYLGHEEIKSIIDQIYKMYWKECDEMERTIDGYFAEEEYIRNRGITEEVNMLMEIEEVYKRLENVYEDINIKIKELDSFLNNINCIGVNSNDTEMVINIKYEFEKLCPRDKT